MPEQNPALQNAKEHLEHLNWIIQELAARPWYRPLFQPFTAENAILDKDSALDPVWRQTNQAAWTDWERLLTHTWKYARHYVADFGHSEKDISPFDHNDLSFMLRAKQGILFNRSTYEPMDEHNRRRDDISVPVYMDYSKEQCTRDLESIRSIVARVIRKMSKRKWFD